MGTNGPMSGHNLPECTSTHVLTESFENIRLSAHTMEYSCAIKNMTHISLYLLLHTVSLVTALAFSSSIQPSSCLNILFFSLYALPSVAPFSGDQLSLVSFFGIRRSSVMPLRNLRKRHSSSIFAKRGTKTKDIDVQIHSSCPI